MNIIMNLEVKEGVKSAMRDIKHRVRYYTKSRLAELKIRPGDIYEDCSYHPVVCLENDEGDLTGISLIDGSGPRCCSMFHCGVIKLTVKEAAEIKKNWKEIQAHNDEFMKQYWENSDQTI